MSLRGVRALRDRKWLRAKAAGVVVDADGEEGNNDDGHRELPCFDRCEEGRLLPKLRGSSGGTTGSNITEC